MAEINSAFISTLKDLIDFFQKIIFLEINEERKNLSLSSLISKK